MANESKNISTYFFYLVALLILLTVAPSIFANNKTQGLKELWYAAKQNNASLSISELDYQAAQKNIDIADSAVYPDIKVVGAYQIQRHDEDFYDLDTGTVAVELTQPLYQPQTKIYQRQTEKSTELVKLQLQKTQQDLTLDLINHYFNVLVAKADLSLAEAKHRADLLQYEKMQTTSAAGLTSQTDLLQAKSTLDLSQTDTIRLNGVLESKAKALAVLVGKPVYKIKSLDQTSPLPEMLTKSEDSTESLEIQMAQVSALNAQEEIEFQRNSNGLNAFLTASYGYNNFDNYSQAMAMQYEDRQNFTLSANLSYPIYDGGAKKAKVSQAKEKHKKSLESLRQAKEQIELAIYQKQTNLKQLKASIAALHNAVDSTKQLLDATETAYDAGLNDLLDVLNARTNRFNSERNLIEAQYLYLQEQLALKALHNALSESDLVVLDNLFTQTTQIK